MCTLHNLEHWNNCFCMKWVILLAVNHLRKTNPTDSHPSFCLFLNDLNGTKQLHKSAFSLSLHSFYMPHIQNLRHPYLKSGIYKNYGRTQKIWWVFTLLTAQEIVCLQCFKLYTSLLQTYQLSVSYTLWFEIKHL